MSAKNKLSAKNLTFCKHYLTNIANKSDAPAVDAALAAGFKNGAGIAVTATRLLKRDDVQAYIDAHQKKLSEKLEITAEKKMGILWSIAEQGMDKDRINAINVLNKMQGHEVVQQSNNGGHVSVVVMLPPNNREVQIINKES